jgi:hypothetical protein
MPGTGAQGGAEDPPSGSGSADAGTQPAWSPAGTDAGTQPAWSPAGTDAGTQAAWGSGSADRETALEPTGGTLPAWGAAAAASDPYAPSWAGTGGGNGGWLQAPPDATPARRRGAWVAVGAVALVVALAAAAITVASGAGRQKKVAARPPASTGGAATPSTTVPPAASTDPSAALLNRLDVTQADAPNGYAVSLLQNGNLVTGQVTLDLCNGTFASESLRTARRQVDLTDPATNLVLSTEAVLYASPAATSQAFSELKARAANCPQTVLPPPPGEAGQGALPAKTTFSAPPDGSWPAVAGVDRLAYAFTTTDQQGNTDNSIAVYLRNGRAFLGIYFSNPGQNEPTIAGKTTVEDIVNVFEQRLAALPAGAVNARVPVPPPNGGI